MTGCHSTICACACSCMGCAKPALPRLQWLLDETDALRQLRSDPCRPRCGRPCLQPLVRRERRTAEATIIADLFQASVVREPPMSRCRSAAVEPAPIFPRDLLIAAYDEDPNDLVHPALIPLCAAFLDRGQAQLNMPLRAQGFYTAWSHIETAGYVLRPAWERAAGQRIRRTGGLDAESVLLALLAELGIAGGRCAGVYRAPAASFPAGPACSLDRGHDRSSGFPPSRRKSG